MGFSEQDYFGGNEEKNTANWLIRFGDSSSIIIAVNHLIGKWI